MTGRGRACRTGVGFFAGVTRRVGAPLSLVAKPLRVVVTAGSNGVRARGCLSIVGQGASHLLVLVGRLLSFEGVRGSVFVLGVDRRGVARVMRRICGRCGRDSCRRRVGVSFRTRGRPVVRSMSPRTLCGVIDGLISGTMGFAGARVGVGLRGRGSSGVLVSVVSSKGNVEDDRRRGVFLPFCRVRRAGRRFRGLKKAKVNLSFSGTLTHGLKKSVRIRSRCNGKDVFALMLPTGPLGRGLVVGRRVVRARVPPARSPGSIRRGSGRIVLVMRSGTRLQAFVGSYLSSGCAILRTGGKMRTVDVLGDNGVVSVVISSVLVPRVSKLRLYGRVGDGVSFSRLPLVLLSTGASAKAGVGNLGGNTSMCVRGPFSVRRLGTRVGDILRGERGVRGGFVRSPLRCCGLGGRASDRGTLFVGGLGRLVLRGVSSRRFSVSGVTSSFTVDHADLRGGVGDVAKMAPGGCVGLVHLGGDTRLLTANGCEVGRIHFLIKFGSTSCFTGYFCRRFNGFPGSFARSVARWDIVFRVGRVVRRRVVVVSNLFGCLCQGVVGFMRRAWAGGVLVGIYNTTVRNVSTAVVAVRMGDSENYVFCLINLPSSTIGRDRRHVVSTLRIAKCGVPADGVIVGVTPTSVHGRKSTCSLPLTVNVLTTGRAVSYRGLPRCLVVNRLDLSKDVRPVANTLPVTVGTHRRKFRKLVMPRRGTHRTTIIGGLGICNMAGVQRMVRFFGKGRRLRPAVIDAQRRFCTRRRGFRYSFSSMGKRRGMGHTLRMTTTNKRGLVLINTPNYNGSVVTGHLPSVLPPLSLNRDLRAAGVRSITKGLKHGTSLVSRHPFHSPRRAVSRATVMKKKDFPRPNRVDLTRGNMLFLSRLPRFREKMLRMLHRPLRSHHVAVSQMGYDVSCPTDFALVTSVGPYPYKCCGRPAGTYIYSPKRMRGCLGGVSNPLLSQVSVRVRVIPIPFRRVTDGQPTRPDYRVHGHMVGTQRVRRRHFSGRPNVCYGTRVADGLVSACTRPSDGKLALLGATVRHFGLSTHTCSHVLGMSHAVTSLRKDRRVLPTRLTRTVDCHGLSERG